MVAPNAPNFLVVGVQKAGTTFLCEKLARHPDIFMAQEKEPMFFQRPMTRESFAEYRKEHFPKAGKWLWRGEGTTTYFQLPRALRNIALMLSPELRVIICLRQPTEKVVSAFFHNWRRDRYPEPVSIFDLPVKTNKIGPLNASLYHDSMVRWLDAFPREQIEVILFDTLKADPAGFVSQALRHLGLDPVASVSKEAVNKGNDLVWDGDVLTVADPKHRWRPAIPKSDLERLHEMYLSDINALDSLLGLGISHWKDFPPFTRHRVEEQAAA